MIVARIVRCFAVDTPAGGMVEQRLAKVLELPIPPARGQLVMPPDEQETERDKLCSGGVRDATGATAGAANLRT